MKKMFGVNVPLSTPMDDMQRVDYASLESLCHFLIEKGVHGLYPNGSTGEMAYLSVDERKKVLEHCIHASRGRCNVFSMVGAATTQETIELAQHAQDAGADGIGVVTPYYYKLDDQELIAHYKAVGQSVSPDFPIYLYGIPQCAVNDISVPLAQRIIEAVPNVVGIKYSYPDIVRLISYMNLKDNTFSVLAGPDNLFFLTLCAGGDGIISGNANVIPEHFVAIYDAFHKGDICSARELQRRTTVLIDRMSACNNMANYKTILKHRGVIKCDQMRAPLRRTTAEEASALINAIEAMDYTNPVCN